MRILLTGGGTGGHFYPLIAVAEEINRISLDKHLVKPDLVFMSPEAYDESALYENNIKFVSITAAKFRRYFSLLNIIDLIKLPFGIFMTFWKLLLIYPDVIFSKGGYGSFPVVFCARLLRIPVILHESDSVPGMVNSWTGKFAYRVALSYPDAAQYFPKNKVAVTGNPIRKEVSVSAHETGREFFELDPNIPVVLILGGSQGSRIINECIIDIVAELVKKYYVIHQTGALNLEEMQRTSSVVLDGSAFKNRYKTFASLTPLQLKMASGASSVIISRAGSTIFEIAAWAVPSIIIPITESGGDHQRKNAYTYARAGAGIVIEENNLKPHVLFAEIERIIGDKELSDKMIASAKKFAKLDAATKIAEALIEVGLSHEK